MGPSRNDVRCTLAGALAALVVSVGCGGGCSGGGGAPPDDAGADGDTPAPDASLDAGGPEAAVPDGAFDSGADGSVADGGADASLPPLRDDAVEPDWSWEQKAARVMDGATLESAFADEGWAPPDGTEIYAARIVDGVDSPAYVLYDAGGGAFSQDFWPASTVKVLSTLGALHFVRERGFSGAATVTWDSGFSDELRAIYDRAIRNSSNIDYDRTVRVAGFDWLNTMFLSESHGFPNAVIQRSYSGIGVRSTPGITLTEGTMSDYVPARDGTGDYGCGDDGNCMSLFELTEAVRRVVLDGEIPDGERFDLAPSDISAVTDALCHATPSFFADGAAAALGETPAICHKPGWVTWNDCLDHGVVTAPSSGERFLLAAAVPERSGSTECLPLDDVAEHVLSALAARDGGVPLQPDAGIPLVVQLDDGGTTDAGRRAYTLTVDAPGADRVVIYTDRWKIGEASGPGPRFSLSYDYSDGGERLLIVRAFAGDEAIGYRSLRVAITPPG